MTEEELKRIEGEGCGCVIASGYGCAAEPLVAEVRRLKGLLASMDDRNEGLRAYGIRHCPWCSWMNDGPGFSQMGMDEHSPKCPAFMPDGTVR